MPLLFKVSSLWLYLKFINMAFGRINTIWLLICFVSSGVSLLMNFFYRPYIYVNHLFDYHIADSYSNFFAIPACLGLVYTFRPVPFSRFKKNIIAVVFFFIIYEFLNYSHQDIFDMLASILSGGCKFLLCRYFRNYLFRMW